MAFHMNKQRGAHMDGKQFGKASGDVKQDSGQHHAPPIHIHIHSHDEGHTVHIMHADGHHEKHDHAENDTEGIKAHIDQHLGGAEGQDHGYSAGEEMENEDTLGGPTV